MTISDTIGVGDLGGLIAFHGTGYGAAAARSAVKSANWRPMGGPFREANQDGKAVRRTRNALSRFESMDRWLRQLEFRASVGAARLG